MSDLNEFDLIENAINKLSGEDIPEDELILTFFDKLNDEYGIQTDVGQLQALVKALGYDDLEYFLDDNPGVVTTIENWITRALRNVPEWRKAIQQSIEGD